MKRSYSVRRTVLHNLNQNYSSFLVCYLIVRSGERSKAPMIPHNGLQIIVFVIYRYIGFKNVEAFPIEQANELYTS
jgi:hypothetical protein